MTKPRLLFVSTRFLFPADTGGQIRTSQVLRGMKGGKFDITLASPAPENAEHKYKTELESVSDHFVSWPEKKQNVLSNLLRMRYLFSNLPIPVITDWSRTASATVERELSRTPDVVVFDFPHSVVLSLDHMHERSVLFTHNVEAEIFSRHVKVSEDPVRRFIWRNQYRKMEAYERKVLSLFDAVVAVSKRDQESFSENYKINNVSVIRTGVDLESFEYTLPEEGKGIVFTGSMDWMANIDGIEYFLSQVWPLIYSREPNARMTVVGRNPPAQLKDKVNDSRWLFTGLVDDIKPYIKRSTVYVVPLRVGGGTRMKVFEAMASGCPLVSTSIGVEGLPLVAGEHYLKADTPEEFSSAVLSLMEDKSLRDRLSGNARSYVEENFSHKKVAEEFEDICCKVLNREFQRPG